MIDVDGSMIDVDAARRYLGETLPADEPVELTDPPVLDAAAAVFANGREAA